MRHGFLLSAIAAGMALAAMVGTVAAGPHLLVDMNSGKVLSQEDAFRRGVDIIAATPGRLLDHMQHGYAKLQDIDVLVLDEADRMLDMGFLPDIKRVLRQLPQRRRRRPASRRSAWPRPWWCGYRGSG